MSIASKVKELSSRISATGKICKADVVKLEQDIGFNLITSNYDIRNFSQYQSSVLSDRVLYALNNMDIDISMNEAIGRIHTSLESSLHKIKNYDYDSFVKTIIGYNDIVIDTGESYDRQSFKKEFKNLSMKDLGERFFYLCDSIGRSCDQYILDKFTKSFAEFDYVIFIENLKRIGVYARQYDIDHPEKNVSVYSEIIFDNLSRHVSNEPQDSITIDNILKALFAVKEFYNSLTFTEQKYCLLNTLESIYYDGDEDEFKEGYIHFRFANVFFDMLELFRNANKDDCVCDDD